MYAGQAAPAQGQVVEQIQYPGYCQGCNRHIAGAGSDGPAGDYGAAGQPRGNLAADALPRTADRFTGDAVVLIGCQPLQPADTRHSQ